MPDASSGSWITEHPYASAGIAVGALVVVWYLLSSSSATTAAASTDTTGAAAVAAAQIAANEQQAALQTQADVTNNSTAASAQVTNNQTAAAQVVALASLQDQTTAALAASTSQSSVAQYNASAEIANSNASVINTMTNASAAEQLSNNATLQSEFTSLAGSLQSFFSGSNPTLTNVTASASSSSSSSSSGVAAGVQQISPASYLWAALGGPWFPIPYGTPTPAVPATSSSSTYSWSTPVQNPNLAGSLQTFTQNFGSLLAGLGKGLQAPVTTQLSPTNVLSLAQINASAVNGWAAHA